LICARRNVLPEIFFGELCVPGMIATNLLCALHFTFTFQDGCWMESQASMPYPQD
jgi:hypothetical protein